MTKRTTKKIIVLITTVLFLAAIQLVVAQTATPTPTATSPYHTPEDTGISLDNTLVIGAVLYGAGVLLTSGAKVIGAKFGGFKFLK